MTQSASVMLVLVALLLSPWLLTSLMGDPGSTGETHRLSRAVIPPELNEQVRLTGHAGRAFNHVRDGEYELWNKVIRGWAYTHIRFDESDLGAKVWTHADGRVRVVVKGLPGEYTLSAHADVVAIKEP